MQDFRYLKLWIEYAKLVDNTEEIFNSVFKQGIGIKFALFYKEFASFYETLERYIEALDVYDLRIQLIKAYPAEHLVSLYEKSIKAYDEYERSTLPPFLQETNEVVTRRMNEIKAKKNPSFGESTDPRFRTCFLANISPSVRSTLSKPSRSISTSFGNDMSSIPATSNSSSSDSTSRISVYQDAESSSTSSRRTVSILSQRSSASQKPSSTRASQFKPTRSSSSQFENKISAEKFADVTIPQAEIKYQTPTDSFKVHVDSKERESVRQLERHNSSLLLETSGEESRVSRLRNHLTKELEGTYVKQSRVDNRNEVDIKHAKRMEKHFKRHRGLYLVSTDSKGKEEVVTVLKTTHSSIIFEEERAIALGIPYKDKPKDEEEKEKEKEEELSVTA